MENKPSSEIPNDEIAAAKEVMVAKKGENGVCVRLERRNT
jgi:hypothetical protein